MGGAHVSPESRAFEVRLDLVLIVQLMTSPEVEAAPAHP